MNILNEEIVTSTLNIVTHLNQAMKRRNECAGHVFCECQKITSIWTRSFAKQRMFPDNFYCFSDFESSISIRKK